MEQCGKNMDLSSHPEDWVIAYSGSRRQSWQPSNPAEWSHQCSMQERHFYIIIHSRQLRSDPNWNLPDLSLGRRPLHHVYVPNFLLHRELLTQYY
jgi:hypothetical protein